MKQEHIAYGHILGEQTTWVWE